MTQALHHIQPRVTAADYLRRERTSEVKHEYLEGKVLGMAGATTAHVKIAGNLYFSLRSRLVGKPCQPYGTDMRIATGRGASYVYPDLTIICGEIQHEPADDQLETVTNPTAVVEVLSPSTANRDRGVKFTAYQQAASFREYVLVAQDAPIVETFYRQDDGVWAFNHAHGLDAVVRLKSIDVQLPLAEIYANVRFDDTTPVT